MLLVFFCLFYLFIYSFIGDGVRTKNWAFQGGMGVEALIRKNNGVLMRREWAL